MQINIWRIAYMIIYEDINDHRSYKHNLSSCEIKLPDVSIIFLRSSKMWSFIYSVARSNIVTKIYHKKQKLSWKVHLYINWSRPISTYVLKFSLIMRPWGNDREKKLINMLNLLPLFVSSRPRFQVVHCHTIGLESAWQMYFKNKQNKYTC